MEEMYRADSILLLAHLEKQSKGSLAAKAEVSAPTFRKVVAGQKPLMKNMAKALSTNEDYPSSFFSADIPEIPMYKLTYRHTSKTTMTELNSVGAEYSLLVHASRVLSHQAAVKPRLDWIDDLAPRNEIVSERQIETIAAGARERMGLQRSGCIPNVTRALERSGIIVAPLHSTTTNEISGQLHSDGVTCPDNAIKLPVIGYSPKPLAGDRERFTKAHELGHLILHHFRMPENYREAEREAHAFAGSFLMPLQNAKVLIHPQSRLSDFLRLKSVFGMSIASIIVRGYNAGIIDRSRRQSLFMQLSSRGWRKNEPGEVGLEVPTLFSLLIKQQYGNDAGRIDSFRAENELSTPFRYLDTWADGLTEQGAELGFASPSF